MAEEETVPMTDEEVSALHQVVATAFDCDMHEADWWTMGMLAMLMVADDGEPRSFDNVLDMLDKCVQVMYGMVEIERMLKEDKVLN